MRGTNDYPDRIHASLPISDQSWRRPVTYILRPLYLCNHPAHITAALRFVASPCRSLRTRLWNAHRNWATHPSIRTFFVAYVSQNRYIVRAFRQCHPFIADFLHKRAYLLSSTWHRSQSSTLSRNLHQGVASLTRLLFLLPTHLRHIRLRFL